METIRTLISKGYDIKWVGYHGPRTVWVHMKKDDQLEQRHIVELQEDYTEPDFRKVLASSAHKPGSNAGTIWSSHSRLELLRLAAILGLNVGGRCIPGCGQEFYGSTGCVMAYDIETDRTRIPYSSFGTLSESITCIATYCSCHDKRLFSFIEHVDYEYIHCLSSSDTVYRFLSYVKSHSPQWLVGFNNFAYDNTRIAYHAPIEFDSILIPMSVGSGSSLTYAYYIDVQGVYNIDLLTYLDKTRRSSYPNMKLATIASYHKAGQKMDFDTADVSNLPLLFEYNLHDSKITMELAFKSSVLEEVISLAAATCSPVIDCVRFVSGTLAACSIASYCLEHRMCMDWSPCLDVKEYRGAEVLKPSIGLHSDVVSCDFSSMYPTILLGANISIENSTTSRSSLQEGSTWVSSTASNFVVDNLRISFDMRRDTVVPPVMRLFVDKRRAAKKTNPPYALALKVAANSIYGSLGDRNSRIYSPNCSASVTTGGRWCLAVAQTILGVYGFKVVYGDTDSCFVAPTSRSKHKLENITSVLSSIFEHTPFPGMSMEIENYYTKIAFLGKKTYFGRKSDDTIVSKGMSKSRKDRVGVCRALAANAGPILLSSLSLSDRQEIVANMITLVVDQAIFRKLGLRDVAKIIKKGGASHYVYISRGGMAHNIECESATGAEQVDYSTSVVCKLLVKEMKAVLAVCGLGSFGYVIGRASIL